MRSEVEREGKERKGEKSEGETPTTTRTGCTKARAGAKAGALVILAEATETERHDCRLKRLYIRVSFERREGEGN